MYQRKWRERPSLNKTIREEELLWCFECMSAKKAVVEIRESQKHWSLSLALTLADAFLTCAIPGRILTWYVGPNAILVGVKVLLLSLFCQQLPGGISFCSSRRFSRYIMQAGHPLPISTMFVFFYSSSLLTKERAK